MREFDYKKIKQKIRNLRKRGKTYKEINQLLGVLIPKSTLSCWCKNIFSSQEYKQRVKRMNLAHLDKARVLALKAIQIKRKRYLGSVRQRVLHLADKIKEKDTAKIALVMLYLGEGSKSSTGSLVLGNSDPLIIQLFLRLLRNCYQIDESKFRCTLQCRADQDIKKLEKFWSEVTKIPLLNFYKAQVDPRTIGKPSKKKDYKGVCRIDYFSADIYNEIIQIINVLGTGS